MNDIEIRLATTADADAVGRLIDAMDAHYNGAGNTAGVDGAVRLARDTIEEREGTRFLIAEIRGRPVGLACFVIIRPGRRHQGLIFVKDLFVMSEARSRGVGQAIMSWLARFAIAEGIGRIDLTTDQSNTRAQALYADLGAERRDVVMYRYGGKALWTLANAHKLKV